MAEKEKNLGLKNTMRLAPKIEFKKTAPDPHATEQLTNAIHSEPVPTPIPVAVPPVIETPIAIDTKRITLDIPVDIYRDLKMAVFDKSITLRRYLLDLIAKDLGRD